MWVLSKYRKVKKHRWLVYAAWQNDLPCYAINLHDALKFNTKSEAMAHKKDEGRRGYTPEYVEWLK